jgi:hypothetical protein
MRRSGASVCGARALIEVPANGTVFVWQCSQRVASVPFVVWMRWLFASASGMSSG